ncbi:lipid-A-disaccharide synthase [bacterium]|nr:lipid-A-disaccharide synthase [bacterium]
MKKISHIFILAGEPSGERYGAALAKNLAKAVPEIRLSGLGGERMHEAGVSLIAHIRSLSFMGFTGIIKHLPLIYAIRQSVLKNIMKTKPDAIVLIDFPDFNLGIAKAVHRWKRHYCPSLKFFYFIPPQVWIWRQSRIHTIKKYCDAVFPIFQFEHELYRKFEIPSYFFGHPISDFLPQQYDQKRAEKQENRTVVSLFPGSRKQEIIKILPVMLKSVRKFNTTHPLSVRINVAEDIDGQLVEKIIRGYELEITLSRNTHQLIAEADLVLSKSGTINLEIAYFAKPAIIIYKTSWLNYWIAKWFIRPKFISLINILSGSEVVREFIQGNATTDNIVMEMSRILSDANYRANMISRIGALKKTIFDQRQPVLQNIAATIIHHMQ